MIADLLPGDGKVVFDIGPAGGRLYVHALNAVNHTITNGSVALATEIYKFQAALLSTQLTEAFNAALGTSDAKELLLVGIAVHMYLSTLNHDEESVPEIDLRLRTSFGSAAMTEASVMMWHKKIELKANLLSAPDGTPAQVGPIIIPFRAEKVTKFDQQALTLAIQSRVKRTTAHTQISVYTMPTTIRLLYVDRLAFAGVKHPDSVLDLLFSKKRNDVF